MAALPSSMLSSGMPFVGKPRNYPSANLSGSCVLQGKNQEYDHRAYKRFIIKGLQFERLKLYPSLLMKFFVTSSFSSLGLFGAAAISKILQQRIIENRNSIVYSSISITVVVLTQYE
ncbi:hypothetical protein HZH66_012484 [Vespula vulgaris]|uniref:Uncharacterized protein n=1 Tax=Vespula vulgaris TaxID=7454 RepID=A0A834J9C8_VESVU|nr:hypothetical protein HZH66_012484 [Vespula vulgaris]